MISKEEVQHISELARLELSDKELEKMQKDLGEILDYVEMLKKVDVSSIGTGAHSVGLNLKNVTREDKESPAPTDTVKKIKTQFPNKEKDYLRVKEILTQQD